MRIIYSNHPVEITQNSLFLCGPSPRSKDVKSWRPEALKILGTLEYSGTIYVPEWDSNVPKINYIEQVEWEYAHLENCGLVVFWVPRKLDTMPAFTTNVEFGSYVRSGRILYGRPKRAEKCEYLDWLYTKVTTRIPHENLLELLKEAISRVAQIQNPNHWVCRSGYSL
jgi:hypothetical protein